ncbi:hypothetical protein ABZ348_12100 [Streptomyces sp. NPDC005963]|uniref:hypothetical protein n=1 Tax=Streptomyces sp. NPDC005963 TaxID=3156721 RepID=UPI0033EAD912
MPQHFGHLLGLPAAVPPLPAAPLVPRADELFAHQSRLKLRHAADALFPDTPVNSRRFRVLDGLHRSERGRHWRAVNRRTLTETKDIWLALPGIDRSAVTALFTRYDQALAADPMALRRIVLYELTALIQQHPRGCAPEAAREFGVDPDECEALAFAVRRRPRLTPEGRAAAEGIVDAWQGGRLRRAGAHATRIGDTGGDQRLDALVRKITQRRAAVLASLAEADRLERAGQRAEAGALRVRAARTAVDENAPLAALLRTPHDGPRITTRIRPDAIDLEWSGDTAGPYRLVRASSRRWTVLAPALDATAFTDTSAPLGERVHYAVLPLEGPQDPRIRELPLHSAPVVFAPDIGEPRTTDARARITAAWEPPPGADGVSVTRDPGGHEVTAALDGFTDTDLAPGDYRYTIRCRYRTATGDEGLSTGTTLSATVHPWPEPITSLDIRPAGDTGAVHAVWSGGWGSELLLLNLPSHAPAEGSDLLLDELPAYRTVASVRSARGSTELRPPRGTRTRLTAVSVVDGRARIGPSIQLELPAPVERLTVRREAPDQAHLAFDWPGDAARVQVSWEQYGDHHQQTITKSAYLTRGGLRLEVGTAAVRFRAEAVVLADADVVIPAGAGATVELPPYRAISYDLVKPAWRAGSRRRVVLRAEYPNRTDPTEGDLPEFVLVARSGGTKKLPPPRPRNPEDGVTVLRLSGAEIGDGDPVQREIDLATTGESAPYTLRAFLLGPHADCTRLKEPPHERLVVR